MFFLNNLNDFSIPRHCFDIVEAVNAAAVNQLHGFCDASNSALCCVVYLRQVVNGALQAVFVLGKSRLVLTHQANWVFSRKDLEAAKLCRELVSQSAVALSHLNSSVHLNSSILLLSSKNKYTNC